LLFELTGYQILGNEAAASHKLTSKLSNRTILDELNRNLTLNAGSKKVVL